MLILYFWWMKITLSDFKTKSHFRPFFFFFLAWTFNCDWDDTMFNDYLMIKQPKKVHTVNERQTFQFSREVKTIATCAHTNADENLLFQCKHSNYTGET